MGLLNDVTSEMSEAANKMQEAVDRFTDPYRPEQFPLPGVPQVRPLETLEGVRAANGLRYSAALLRAGLDHIYVGQDEEMDNRLYKLCLDVVRAYRRVRKGDVAAKDA